MIFVSSFGSKTCFLFFGDLGFFLLQKDGREVAIFCIEKSQNSHRHGIQTGNIMNFQIHLDMRTAARAKRAAETSCLCRQYYAYSRYCPLLGAFCVSVFWLFLDFLNRKI